MFNGKANLLTLQLYTTKLKNSVEPLGEYIVFFELGDNPLDSLNETGKLVIVLCLLMKGTTVGIWK